MATNLTNRSWDHIEKKRVDQTCKSEMEKNQVNKNKIIIYNNASLSIQSLEINELFFFLENIFCMTFKIQELATMAKMS